EIVKLLLDRGDIDINTKSSSGDTVLIVACCHFKSDKSVHTLELLLGRRDLEVNATNQHGDTALIKLCKQFYEQETLAGTLLKRQDIDVNIKNKEGKTALMIAKENGHKNIAKLL
ncbi:ankyrin repeat-containing domain protein, partial [Pyronema domesticum]